MGTRDAEVVPRVGWRGQQSCPLVVADFSTCAPVISASPRFSLQYLGVWLRVSCFDFGRLTL